MPKTAVALFETSSTADKVVAHLLKSDFARDEIKVVSRSDFEGKPAPETDILKLGGLPQIHAGRYWDAVRNGRVLVTVTASGDRADRAADIMNQDGAVSIEERITQAMGSGQTVDPTADSGLFPKQGAAQLFDVT
jgi:hypothetical protein